VAAIVDNPEHQQAVMNAMREILSNVLKEAVRIRSPWPSHFTLSRSTSPLIIRKTMPAPRIPRTMARSKPTPNLRSRVAHLAFVRQLSCVACGKAAPSDAAHVRTGTDGAIGRKPGDRYAVPLCTACHAKQHRVGELTFWSALHIDPLNVAFRLWTISADVEAGERTVFRARQRINLAKALS
jgi:hypothetical protein